MSEFTDKVVIITGGTSGIGRAVAEHFFQLGANISVCSIDEHQLQEMQKKLEAVDAERVYFSLTDVSQEDQVKTYIQGTYDKFGSIDMLINNAGVYPQARLEDMSTELWDITFAVNIRSLFLCTREAVRYMKKHGGGVVANAASFAGIIPSIGAGAYAATKAGIISLTRTFAAELAPYKIRVNAYVPGVIETEMTREVLQQERETKLEQLPLRAFGSPEDVVNTVEFLTSCKSSYITGTTIEVTGGKLCVQNAPIAYQGRNNESN